MSNRKALYVLPALKAGRDDRGRVILTRKFVDGASAYVERWPGPVVVCMAERRGEDSNLDQVAWDTADLPFEFRWLEADESRRGEQVEDARVVLASLVDEHTRMVDICSPMEVPVAYVSEYTLDTRKQIIRAETSNPLLRWRRNLWTTGMQRRCDRAIRAAAGVQCNGAPTYIAYRMLNKNALLYFDTRVRHKMLAGQERMQSCIDRMMRNEPLRLAFSGRLIAIKGADHLPRVARELKRLRVPFTLDICGDGSLADRIRADINRWGLNEHVRMRGVLDFKSELVPTMTDDIDLFVCCHRQGDPACTYMETMSCGTPIVGYDNEAFAGVVNYSSTGWLSAMDRPRALARLIAELNADRRRIAEASIEARDFAAQHDFEITMTRRVGHLMSCCTTAEKRAA